MRVDHLLADGMSAGVIFLEIDVMMYASFCWKAEYPSRPRPTARSYLESPEVCAWIEFAESNDARLYVSSPS